MNHGTGELSQVEEVSLLTSRLGRRHSKQCMVHEKCKISTLEHESEVIKRRVGSQEFSVKGGIFLLGVGELLVVHHVSASG